MFSRILRTKVTQISSTPVDSALISNSNNAPPWNNAQSNSNNAPRFSASNQMSQPFRPPNQNKFCAYCKKPGHTKFECRKLQYKNSLANNNNNANTNKTVLMTADEFERYAKYQETLEKNPSGHISFSTTAVVASIEKPSSKWITDSGATDHMTGNSYLLSDIQSNESTHAVTLADGSQTHVYGTGKANSHTQLPLKSVSYLPNLSFNLMSVSQITSKLNCCVSFFPDHCLFQDLTTKQIIGRGQESGGLYTLNEELSKNIACSSMISALKVHCQLGHPSLTLLKKLCPQFNFPSTINCESCQFAKHHRVSSYPRLNKRANSVFDLVHSDVWGPCFVVSKKEYRYFVTFVDDHSRVTWLYLMKNRSALFSIFCNFCAEIKNQFNVSLKTLRSDNAKEYTSSLFSDYMANNGILHETSCVDTASQNGVAERKNMHLIETTRAFSFHMNVPKVFLGRCSGHSMFSDQQNAFNSAKV